MVRFVFLSWLLVGFGPLLRNAEAGFATKPSGDPLRASAETRYYWKEKDVLKEARCVSGDFITFGKCQKRKKTWGFQDVRSYLWSYLRVLYPYQDQSAQLTKEAETLEGQVAIFSQGPVSTAVEKKISDLKARAKTTREAISRLVKPEDVLKDIDLAIMSPPEKVAIAGDGIYPLTEGRGDLLTKIFDLVAEDDIAFVSCSDRSLFNFLEKEVTHNDITSRCSNREERLPNIYDLKGQHNLANWELDKRAAWAAQGCRNFAVSPVARALPTMENGTNYIMWLQDNHEMFGREIQAAFIGPEGNPCRTSDPINFHAAQLAGGVCVRDRSFIGPSFSSAFPPPRSPPCGKWATGGKT